MTPRQLSSLLVELLGLPHETEWVEWKHNNSDPAMIGEYLSALSNSAALHGRETAYMVWGIEDGMDPRRKTGRPLRDSASQPRPRALRQRGIYPGRQRQEEIEGLSH